MDEENILRQRFVALQTEFNKNTYRYFVLNRELAKVEEDILRIEAGLAEMEHALKDMVVAKAKEETQDKQKEK